MNIEDDLKPTVADHIHSAVSAMASVVPCGSEFFNALVTKPMEERRNNWIFLMEKRITYLEQKGLKVDDLKNNDDFVSAVAYASSISSYTKSKIKIQALINAVTNAALLPTLDSTKKSIFLRYIDQFTEWHLKTLYYFENPINRFFENGLTPSQLYTSSILQYFKEYYGENIPNDEVMKIIINDLYDASFINIKPDIWHVTMSGTGALESRITDLGKDFFMYIHNVK